MSDLHSETIKMPCSNPHCTCEIPKGGGVKVGEETYCNERCADPSVKGCGHEGCPCNDVAGG